MRPVAILLMALMVCGNPGNAGAVPVFSASERAEGLRQGLGMGLALPADNNGYPGPKHVLDLADQLQLTTDQRRRTEALFAAMRAEAIPAAERLLADEAALERQFVERVASEESIRTALDATAASAKVLQFIHLRYHLSTAALLSPEQIRLYAQLRARPRRQPEPQAPPTSNGDHAHQPR